MPRAVSAVPHDIETITRPVVMGVAREMLKVLRLDHLGAQVMYPGGSESIAQPGTSLDGDRAESDFGHHTQLKLEAQERAVEDRVLTIAVHQNDQTPIFHDPLLGVRLVPVFAQHEVQITFVVRAESRAQAQRLRQDILMRTAMLRDTMPLQMTYSYAIPYEFLHLLLAVYKLRENQAGYGESFGQWVGNHIDARHTTVVNMAGKWPELRIPDTQIHNWGAFSDPLPAADAADKDGNSGKYTVTFTYRFQYDKPIGCRAEWPLVVHNQMMDKPWVYEQNASGEQIDPWRQKHRASRSRSAMDVIMELYDRPCVMRYTEAVVPSIDEWYPQHTRPDTASMLQVLIGAVGSDLHDVIDLRDVPEFEIDADVLEFLKTEAPWMHQYGHSVCHLSFYEGDVPQHDNVLTVSEQLAVRTRNPMDLRKTYRLRMELITDLYSLHPAARKRLENGGKGAWKLLVDLQYRLRDTAYVPELINDQYISPGDIKIIADRLLETKRPVSRGREAIMLTVGNYTIVTRRMPQNPSEISNARIDETSPGNNPSGPGGGQGPDAGSGGGQDVSRCCS